MRRLFKKQISPEALWNLAKVVPYEKIFVVAARIRVAGIV
jgi:hypothetical protein